MTGLLDVTQRNVTEVGDSVEVRRAYEPLGNSDEPPWLVTIRKADGRSASALGQSLYRASAEASARLATGSLDDDPNGAPE